MFYDWVIRKKEEGKTYFFIGRETKSAIWSILMNALKGSSRAQRSEAEWSGEAAEHSLCHGGIGEGTYSDVEQDLSASAPDLT
jgi:hypothetical protein